MNGRVAVVTGGTRGLGAAISSALAARGATVVAVFRADHEAAQLLRAQCGDAVVGRQADVTDPEVCRELVAEVVQVHGRIDYLVNNAGSLREARVAEVTADMWRRTLDANLSAAFYLAQAAMAPMRAAGFGRIVNVGSVSALMGSPFQVDYAAAKAGLVGLTRSLARSVARSSVTVNCVVPGGFETDLLGDLTLTDRAVVEAAVPVGRYGRPPELAHAVLSLLADDASYITGASLVVDGGLSMGG
jgi:NAD(P)-dependent dehydrogenase (short-subunit alcohol dehydrogenase family)